MTVLRKCVNGFLENNIVSSKDLEKIEEDAKKFVK